MSDNFADPIDSPAERANLARLFLDAYDRKLYIGIYLLWESFSERMWQKGYWYDYKKLAEIAFRSLARTNETSKRAQLAYELGWAYMEEREFKQARMLFKEAQDLYTESNDFGGVFRVLRDLGSLQFRLDRLGSALILYREMERRLEIEDKIDVQTRTMREAEISNLLGNTFTKLHDFTKGERYLDVAIRKYKSLGNTSRYYLTAPLLNTGWMFYIRGNTIEAKRFLNECLTLSREIIRKDTIAGALIRLAEIEFDLGNESEANRYLHQAELEAGVDMAKIRDQVWKFSKRISFITWIKTYCVRNYRLLRMLVDLVVRDPKTGFITIVNYVSTGTKGAI